MYVVFAAEAVTRHDHSCILYFCLQVLQMIGRAGRPGFDTHADAVVMVRAEMKEYYKRVSALHGSDTCLHFKKPVRTKKL